MYLHILIKRIVPWFCLILVSFVRTDDSNITDVTSSSNSTNTSSSPPDDDFWISSSPIGPNFYEYKMLPWGYSSDGNINDFGSPYFENAKLLDIVRPGWSWNSNRHKQIVAPFCYATVPYGSTCFWGQVKQMCETVLQGTLAYDSGMFCLSSQPHTIVGPVCWERTCYGEATRQACAAVDGSFVGGESPSTHVQGVRFEALDVGWCVVPGDDHTLFGPACYGTTCYVDELQEACQKMNGTNFANIFCLLKKSYSVVGPVCTPTTGTVEEQVPNCYPEETTQFCAKMGGTSVGGIFCILNGNTEYSVLGPFCPHIDKYDAEPEMIYATCVDAEVGTLACQALAGQSIGNGTFCILEGKDYHLMGPLCGIGCIVYGDFCRSKFGGQPVGEYYCIVQGDYTIVGPSSYGDVSFRGEPILANDVSKNTVHDLGFGWTVLNGTYTLYGPTCWGSTCYDGDCIGAGGSRISSLFCVMQMDATSSRSSSSSSSSRPVPSYLPTAAGLIVSLFLLILPYFDDTFK